MTITGGSNTSCIGVYSLVRGEIVLRKTASTAGIHGVQKVHRSEYSERASG